jgi:hypothetical protein
MNTLRTVAWGGGGFSALLALWATIHYGGSVRFLPTVVLGLVAATLPFGIAYTKRAVTSTRRRFADVDAGISAEKGSIFVSTTTVDDPLDCLETIVPAVRADDDYDEVTRESFQEGPGLMVLYGGFHNAFVRITEAGRVVVTGASEHTHALADTVGDACALSFERTRNNPFSGLEPVQGAARVFLGVIVLTLLLGSTVAVGTVAYPSDTYNPAERTVLVGIDARGDFVPGVDRTDTQLSKAAFIVAVVDEGSQEVTWAQNDSERVTAHGRQALQASRDARALLTTVREEPLTPTQTDRADRLDRRLVAARESVAAAMTARVENGSVNETAEMRRVVAQLRADPGAASAST